MAQSSLPTRFPDAQKIKKEIKNQWLEKKQRKRKKRKMTMNGDAPEEYEYDRAKEVKEFDESKIGCKGLVDSGATTIPRFFIQPNPQSFIKPSPPSSSHLIPTIDLSHALSHRRSEIIHQIRHASHTWGFFQVIHHDIPISVLDDTISAVRSFNELPTEIKSQHYHREMGSSVNFQTNFDLYRSSAATWRDTLQVRLGPDPPVVDRIPDACRRELMEWDGTCGGWERC
ncbi:Oxoglutarate/iron-dependent dioxygenase [Cinnamomum micranthum f. kanehirae]|uniref:Oxoglutarate/iron-dependent dioxygenase n=1 Tax=Cinnamomum micranthum f. kanehirae TaxID=337451 RepID=A0A3S3MUH1_9MAGN|nr:Oxoglutarate/iron-dependent dioxygenase [Cinnamomum micranthum f. kanehirae]